MNELDIGYSALRTVVIVGDAGERTRAVAGCRQLGFILEGWTGTGRAGMELIASLPSPPGLVIVDLCANGMDGADLIRSLAMLEGDIRLVVCGTGCPRIRDTALVLAAALGLQASAAVSGPLSAATLRAAVIDSTARRACAAASARGRGAEFAAPDAIDIRSGLLRNEFELHYQPKVAMENGEPRGYEALLRWRHPRHGLLAPGSFLQQTEAAGLIQLLTAKVLRMALADSQALRSASLRFPISVNLSPISLTNADLADQITDAMHRAGLPSSAIVFEVTEHTEIADLGAALAVLLKLRLRGHRLSLDDYGAGHASILQLSRIPFSELKLDRRLVHDSWRRPHLEPLLRQAIGSARELGMTSVAEGIETREDWDFLRGLGCDQAQGYLVARPMEPSLLPSWRPDPSLCRYSEGEMDSQRLNARRKLDRSV